MFIDPAKGDYRVRADSPALQIGFKNFPMDRFGVQKAKLKAIARVPVFPVPMIGGAPDLPRSAAGTWLGAKVKAISGEEFSAFGVRKEDGGIHLIAVPVKSPAAKAGFKPGDLVQSINGQAVKTIADLRKHAMKQTDKHSAKPARVRFVRNQKEQVLDVESLSSSGVQW